MSVEVNYLAVILAAVSSMVVGMVWYIPSIFGNTWMKLTKVDPNKAPDNPAKTYGLTFLASLATAYVLAHVAFLSNKYFGNSFIQDAVTTAFWLWLGFTASRILVHDLFERRRLKLTLINSGHELATVLVMGVIIGLFGV